ncbi:GNAT family acetyltransferase [soil metagenome]
MDKRKYASHRLTFKNMTIRTYNPDDREAVVDVWRKAGLVRTWNDPHRDIDRKVANDPGGFLVPVEDGQFVGAVMAGYDGHRGWIQYLGVDPSRQRSGIGRALVAAAIELLRGRGCPKINHQVRRTNREVIEFYQRIGFSEDDVLSMGLRLIEDVAPNHE